MLHKIIDRQATEIEDALGEEIMPSNKKAVITLIDLRTKVEILSVSLKVSLALNCAFVSALVLRLLLK